MDRSSRPAARTTAWCEQVRDDRLTGALPSAVAALPLDRQARVFAGVNELPPQIGMLSLRKLVPLMGQTRCRPSPQPLHRGAVTAAGALEVSVAVTTDSPLLRHACAALRIDLAVTTV